MDAAYIRAYYPNGFNIFNELPLHLCNIKYSPLVFSISAFPWRGFSEC